MPLTVSAVSRWEAAPLLDGLLIKYSLLMLDRIGYTDSRGWRYLMRDNAHEQARPRHVVSCWPTAFDSFPKADVLELISGGRPHRGQSPCGSLLRTGGGRHPAALPTDVGRGDRFAAILAAVITSPTSWRDPGPGVDLKFQVFLENIGGAAFAWSRACYRRGLARAVMLIPVPGSTRREAVTHRSRAAGYLPCSSGCSVRSSRRDAPLPLTDGDASFSETT